MTTAARHHGCRRLVSAEYIPLWRQRREVDCGFRIGDWGFPIADCGLGEHTPSLQHLLAPLGSGESQSTQRHNDKGVSDSILNRLSQHLRGYFEITSQ